MALRVNQNYVNDGFAILQEVLVNAEEEAFKDRYGSNWWNRILDKLSDKYGNLPYKLPQSGTDEQLRKSIDISNSIILFERTCRDFFGISDNEFPTVSNYTHELINNRNKIIGHIGIGDIDQKDAERTLDSMTRLCDYVDRDEADRIRQIYLEVRNNVNQSITDSGPVPVEIRRNLEQSNFTVGKKVNLMELVGTDVVQPTTLKTKVTFAGETKSYTVYKVKLDALYYNDQNDRIATWIDRYSSEHGADALKNLNQEQRNEIIENFIFESNPEAIKKTQSNILLTEQRVPGVTLSDGRIVDGNRRFTCLRRIQRDTAEPVYFETAIMDVDIETDKKQIKMLELAIQHGEEKKVDYDLIDYALGTYRDIELEKTLTVDEYAKSANESVAEVKKRIEIAKVIAEFLQYIKLPMQFFVAREYQVYSLFYEMMPVLNKLDPKEKELLKTITFNNILLHALLDQRKFIRDIKMLITKNSYKEYFNEQVDINTLIHEKFDGRVITNKDDADAFANENEIIREKLKKSMDVALQLSRRKQLKSQPMENVSKSISTLADIDEHVFEKMNNAEKEELRGKLNSLSNVVNEYKGMVSGMVAEKPKLAISNPDIPLVVCRNPKTSITSTSVEISFGAVKECAEQEDTCIIKAYFVDEEYRRISNINRCEVKTTQDTVCDFILDNHNEIKKVFLLIQSDTNVTNEVLRIIPFNVQL